MIRPRSLTLLVVFAACVAGPAATASAQSGPPDLPAKCLQVGPSGEPPTCTQDATGKWTVSQPDGPAASDGGGGIAIFVVLGLLVGGGILFWRVWMAQRMATEAGMDPGRATAMTLLTDDGLDATYLASSLRGNRGAEPAPAAPTRSPGDRLRELEKLRAEGLLTPAEYDARRQAIVDSV